MLPAADRAPGAALPAIRPPVLPGLPDRGRIPAPLAGGPSAAPDPAAVLPAAAVAGRQPEACSSSPPLIAYLLASLLFGAAGLGIGLALFGTLLAGVLAYLGAAPLGLGAVVLLVLARSRRLAAAG